MPKKRHSEEQIVAALRQGQVGEKVAEICRRLGISEGRTTCGRSSMPDWESARCVSC